MCLFQIATGHHRLVALPLVFCLPWGGGMLLHQFEGAVISRSGDFLLQITPKTNSHDEMLSSTVLRRDISQLRVAGMVTDVVTVAQAD